MQPNSDKITFLYPAQSCDLAAMRDLPPMGIFADQAVEFLNALSGVLMKNPIVRTMPDVATFGFFCRKGSILAMRDRFCAGDAVKVGRGLLFHVAPSNVPVNFAYSLVCGVLSGNANVVRVPSKEFEQVAVIVAAIEQVLASNPVFAARIALVRYERGSTATDTLSALCDVRVVWGGDQTIATIRQSPIPPRSFDVTFADRYSICAIDAAAYLERANVEKVAEDFYNDTYLFDQNACSAPHLVVWRGQASVVEAAKAKFWATLYAFTEKKYSLVEVLAVDKLTAFYAQSITMDIHKEATQDNLIWRVSADALPDNIDTYRCKAGYFTEHRVDDLAQVAHIINRKYQTMAHWGFSASELKEFVAKARPLGIDRIVPIGKTTTFDLVWDGYDLINTLSRNITILEK